MWKALLGLACAPLVAVAVGQPFVALTPCGPVLGSTAPAANATVASFRGIRFGAPPERWRPPVAAPCWSGTLNATALGPVCVQSWGVGSEDCLFLSVFAPLVAGALPGPGSLLPVHVYIHGGSLVEGSGDTDAASFSARTNVVSVVIQYRLSWAGWLLAAGFAADAAATGNAGVLDMQLALRWVRANAAAFGGDAARVTLAGQSSGGTAIFALLASPASRGLFHGAIALSGSPNITQTPREKLAQDAAFVAAAGCGSRAPAAELACLRAASVASLTSAQLPSWFTPGIFSLQLPVAGFTAAYGGLVYVDGVVVALPFEDALAAATVDVPLILSGQAQECDLGPGDDVRALSPPAWLAWLGARARAGGWGARAPALAAALADAYAPEARRGAQCAYDTISADYGTACALARIATRAKRGGARASPIYVAVNQWPPSVPIKGGGAHEMTFAYHMFDWLTGFELWPAPANASASFPGAPDRALAAFLQGAWASLMHTGRVDAAWGGWRSVEDVPGWPASYGSLRISSADLPPFAPTAFVADQRAAVCAVFDAYGMSGPAWWWVN